MFEIAGGRIIGFIPFPRVLVLCEMQSVSSRIWTRITVFISHDDNNYTTGTSVYCTEINCTLTFDIKNGFVDSRDDMTQLNFINHKFRITLLYMLICTAAFKSQLKRHNVKCVCIPSAMIVYHLQQIPATAWTVLITYVQIRSKNVSKLLTWKKRFS